MPTSTVIQYAVEGTNYLWDSFWGVLTEAGLGNFYIVMGLSICVISLLAYGLWKSTK